MALAKLYDAALAAAGERADADGALALLRTLLHQRLPAGYVAHGSVLKALCNAGRLQV